MNLTTKQFSELNGVAIQTVRNRLCKFGNYFGVVPMKKFNKRLSWPAEKLESTLYNQPNQQQ